MKKIACKIEEVEMLTSIYAGGTAGVMFVKTMVLWILYGLRNHEKGCWGLAQRDCNSRLRVRKSQAKYMDGCMY